MNETVFDIIEKIKRTDNYSGITTLKYIQNCFAYPVVLTALSPILVIISFIGLTVFFNNWFLIAVIYLIILHKYTVPSIRDVLTVVLHKFGHLHKYIKDLNDEEYNVLVVESNRRINKLKIQIKKLAKQFEKVDKKVSNELVRSLQLYQIGQVENAIEDLVKIIEHLLSTYYIGKEEFKKWCKEKKRSEKQPKLADLLEYSLHEKQINEIEHKFFTAIKEIRNREDHTLDLKLDDYINVSGLITSIGAIMKFSQLVYPSIKEKIK